MPAPKAPRIRSAASPTSPMAASADRRAASRSGSSSLFLAVVRNSAAHPAAASLTDSSAIASASPSTSIRPAGISVSTCSAPAPASRSRATAFSSIMRPQRRAAASTAGADSSSEATEVTRSTRSCASSMITTSCSGKMSNSSSASIASSAWLVTTMSAWPGLVPGVLGETLRAERAALHAQALAGADRDLAPGLVPDSRHQLVAIAGRGRGRPVVQPLHLPSERRDRSGIEQRLLRVVRRPAAQPLQAQIVPAALEDGEHRLAAQGGRDRGGQPRQVPVDELTLERDRGRRDDDGPAPGDGMPRGWHEIRQRLARSGTGLDRQVLTGLDRLLYGARHRDLARALRSADPGHGHGEQASDVSALVGGHGSERYRGLAGDVGPPHPRPGDRAEDDHVGRERRQPVQHP